MILEVRVVERQIADLDDFQPELRQSELRQGSASLLLYAPLRRLPTRTATSRVTAIFRSTRMTIPDPGLEAGMPHRQLGGLEGPMPVHVWPGY